MNNNVICVTISIETHTSLTLTVDVCDVEFGRFLHVINMIVLPCRKTAIPLCACTTKLIMLKLNIIESHILYSTPYGGDRGGRGGGRGSNRYSNRRGGGGGFVGNKDQILRQLGAGTEDLIKSDWYRVTVSL